MYFVGFDILSITTSDILYSFTFSMTKVILQKVSFIKATISKDMLLFAIGFLSASLSSMFGVGGGALMVPLILFCTGFTFQQAVPICLGSLLIPFILAIFKNPATTSVPLNVYVLMTLGGCAGALIGTYLGGVLPIETLKKGLGVLLVLVSVRLFWG
jgi:uncharacterized protein